VIYEWKMDGVVRNYGDALAELITPPSIYKMWAENQDHMYFPLGSVICNEIIEETLRLGLKPVFITCGWRGEELDSSLVELCEFRTVRGPNTQAELARHGIDVEFTRDPAYVLPELLTKAQPNGLAFVMRHLKDPSEYNEFTAHEYGADEIYSAVVETLDDTIRIVHKISGARFVLAGSMHAAMTAHAYGVPFALLDGPYIDCLPKWYDWFASVDLGEPVFVNSIVEGRQWYNDNVRNRNNDGI
jgi:hypothetical protein